VDLFTKSVVLTLSSLVLYAESKTESIDTIFTIIHRTKSVSWREKRSPALNLDDIQRIYSLLNLCWLSHYLCYTQNWKLNRLTPFSPAFIEQKCQLVGKTTSSIEFRRYSLDLFIVELVVTLLSLVLNIELKTESIDAIFTIIHRTKVSLHLENPLQHWI